MIVAVIPALDEAPRIAAVLDGLAARVDRCIVVDDGSVDGTGEIALAHSTKRPFGSGSVEVVRNPRPAGVGAAIASGCMRAREQGAAIVVVLAGDGQMDPADLRALIGPILRGDADFVKGNRLAWPGGALAFPLGRLIGVVALSAMTRVATGLAIDDAQCGYVAFGPRALAAIDWQGLWPYFGYPNDLLGSAARLGLRVLEVPVRPVYAGEHSKLRARHYPGIAWVLARAAFRRLC